MARETRGAYGRPDPADGGWLVLSVPAPARGEELLLIDALRRVGARAVERRGHRYEALLPPGGSDPVRQVVAEATAAVRASTSLGDPQIRWYRLPHEEWARGWRRGQPERRVSDRIVIAPAMGGGPAADPDGPGDAVGRGEPTTRRVRLEPAVAFGTAEHATTRACLRILDRRLRSGDRILDVGAGSGVLGIAAAVLGASRVLALESDPASCEAVRRNASLNGVAKRIEVRRGEVRPGDLGSVGRFDGVLANLGGAVLISLSGDLAAAVERDGWIALSGVLRAERDAVIAAGRRAGLSLAAEEREAGWWTGVFLPASGGR